MLLAKKITMNNKNVFTLEVFEYIISNIKINLSHGIKEASSFSLDLQFIFEFQKKMFYYYYYYDIVSIHT